MMLTCPIYSSRIFILIANSLYIDKIAVLPIKRIVPFFLAVFHRNQMSFGIISTVLFRRKPTVRIIAVRIPLINVFRKSLFVQLHIERPVITVRTDHRNIIIRSVVPGKIIVSESRGFTVRIHNLGKESVLINERIVIKRFQKFAGKDL